MSRAKRSASQVVITGPPIAEEGMELLGKECSVQCIEPYLQPSEIARVLRDKRTDGLLVRMGRITREVIEASPNLRVIAKHGTGVDNIDLSAATELGIPVLIAPFANYQSVAEHVLGLMLALAKDIPRLDARIRESHWDKPNYRGVELSGKTLGLVGFGRIGRRVRQLVAPLEMKVSVYDPFLKPDEVPPGVRRVEKLEELLECADIVSLHCPLTRETRHLIGEKEFRIMKRTAWLINTARGEVVDEEALIDALKGGEIAGAGIDTFSSEPPRDISGLAHAGKTVLTPHIAGITEESFRRLGIEAAKNILTILQGRTPDRECLVNPEVLEHCSHTN
ncbi:MAG: hydroxyacid dehydrogenase [Deltaproteobacteria bacterium]|nr:hydroxyacid dehydrogenase [Deltaproteobacteria bacterium]